MLTAEQAAQLRELVARHAHCQFRAARLAPETDPDVRARVYAAADAAARTVCSLITTLTHIEVDFEIL